MRTFISFLLLITCSACLYAQSQADSVAIVDLLKRDYATLGNYDYEQHRKNCTADYILVENGEVWNLEREVADMKSRKGTKTIRVDEFDFHSVHVEGSFAYSVYELKSVITRNGQTKNYHWTESAIFKKVGGDWKIKLIHSTRINN